MHHAGLVVNPVGLKQFVDGLFGLRIRQVWRKLVVEATAEWVRNAKLGDIDPERVAIRATENVMGGERTIRWAKTVGG